MNFLEDLSYENDEAVAGMMARLIEVGKHQEDGAVMLTKLVIEKSTEDMNEE